MSKMRYGVPLKSLGINYVCVFAYIAVPVIQIGMFIMGWSVLVAWAESLGRFKPQWFELEFLYGFFTMSVLFVLSSILHAFSTRVHVNWITMILGLFFWSIPLLSALDSRPIAIPVFILLGSVILVIGTGFALPILVSSRLRIQ